MGKRVITFYLLTLVITIVLAIIQEQIGLANELIILPQLGPAFAALIVFFVFKKNRIPIEVGMRKGLPELILVFVVPIIIIGISFLLYRQFHEIMLTELSIDTWMILPGMLIGAMGEELGWRGYLLPELRTSLKPVQACVLTGFMWGLWHMGNYQFGILYMVGMILFAISSTLILYWIMRFSGNNIILATGFHFAINLSYYFFYIEHLTEETVILVSAGIWTIAGLGLVLLRRADFEAGLN